jgi:hypothetical protein
MRLLKALARRLPGIRRVVDERNRYHAERIEALAALELARTRIRDLEELLAGEGEVRRRNQRQIADERRRRGEFEERVQHLEGELRAARQVLRRRPGIPPTARGRGAGRGDRPPYPARRGR